MNGNTAENNLYKYLEKIIYEVNCMNEHTNDNRELAQAWKRIFDLEQQVKELQDATAQQYEIIFGVLIKIKEDCYTIKKENKKINWRNNNGTLI